MKNEMTDTVVKKVRKGVWRMPRLTEAMKDVISCDNTAEGAESHEERHDGDKTENLREDEEGGGVDTHDFEGVNLLGGAHRTQFRSNVRAHLSRKDETHDARRELQEHDFTGDVSRDPVGHPGTLDIELNLYTDDGSDKEGDEEDDADGVDTELRHFLDVLFEEHAHSLRTGEGAPHEHEVATEMHEKFIGYHFRGMNRG